VLKRALYVADGRLVTCAGGIAGLDLAVSMITRDHGAALGSAVGEWHIRTQPREGSGPQRMALPARYQVWNPRVLRVLDRMERNVADPLSSTVLAAGEGISVRQLERLFLHHMQAGVGETYRAIRLARALTLLRETSLGIAEIGLACGFGSPAHFSRAFHQRHGFSPRDARKSPPVSG